MLRRIDPVLMLRRYLSGEFKNITPPKAKITMSNAFVNLNQRIGSDQTSEIYRFNDKTNSGQLVVTTNHEQYRHNKDINDGKESKKPIPYCQWCRREIKGDPIGIPISMTVDRITNNATFDVEDTHDTFGCALAMLKRVYSCSRSYRDPLYMDAEQMLHCLYYRMYPDKKGTRIEEAEDWRLLRSNGGPLDDEEYDSKQYKYVKVPNVVTLPIKRQYIKLKLKTK